MNSEIQDKEDFQSVALTPEMIEKQEDDMSSSVALGGPGKLWIDVASAKAVQPHRA